ncbi:MAG: 2-dehydropantoate 2-reductase N-terminal domain-containing protein, partial [Chloroflexota bacterium]
MAVIGAGAWGTTLATMLSKSAPVTLVARDEAHAAALRAAGENRRYLPGVPLDERIRIAAAPTALSGASELVIFAVPSRAMRSVASAVAAELSSDAVLLSVAKGIERDSLLRMTEVIAEVVPAAASRVAALSGPNLALEISRGLPAAAVVAAADDSVSRRVVELLGGRTFRLYRNRDVVGVELAGALK